MAEYYLWFKALHVVSVIAWMAALLYLPRLFVYHVSAPAGSPASETFKVMERRLARGIMTPSMIAAFLFGGLMLATPGAVDFKTDGWLHAKLLLVLIMAGLHGGCIAWMKAFAENRNRKSAKFFRVVNEVPALLMLAIVILVIVKPF